MTTRDPIHDYRKAIADDCIVGVCSVNNCLYPSCSPSGRAAEHTRLIDDPVKVTHGHSMLFDDGYSGYSITDKAGRIKP